jgi:microcystin-dependent protein
MFGGNFAPAGWALCDGRTLAIAEYDPLFALIGTTYGGDGQTTFNLPDLRGRLPVHQGNGFVLAQTGGVESVTLTVQQLPTHTHALLGSTNPGGTTNPPTNVVAQIPGGGSAYIEDSPSVSMATESLLPVGASQPHENLQPYVCVNFIINLHGLFPSQN